MNARPPQLHTPSNALPVFRLIRSSGGLRHSFVTYCQKWQTSQEAHKPGGKISLLPHCQCACFSVNSNHSAYSSPTEAGLKFFPAPCMQASRWCRLEMTVTDVERNILSFPRLLVSCFVAMVMCSDRQAYEWLYAGLGVIYFPLTADYCAANVNYDV